MYLDELEIATEELKDAKNYIVHSKAWTNRMECPEEDART
jgi:pimeloyl-CoA synthetase